MRKMLVVGCGGSGGATLGFMMDQLKAELAPFGITSLPAGWQFVHVDVPKVGDGGSLIATVAEQGGAYVSTAPAAGSSYSSVDGTLAERVSPSGELASMGTWMPRIPDRITVPVTVGAGQLRAVGRVLTLAQAPKVFDGLKAAWERMFSDEPEMHRVATAAGDRFDAYQQSDVPLVFVVSSMAGGAGASMALDVCRILTGIPALDPRLMGVFMFSPDTFNELAPSDRGGVRANGLAMLGEIIASQTKSANDHDVAVLRALGIATDPTVVPFARVFPIGRTMGVTEAVFGDGTMKGVYRGLGRGLAGLAASDTAMSKYVSYDLGNSNPTQTRRSIFGWGESERDLQWGSFGFASLSMGRDRYRHYAAQRLARASVDRLVNGHRQGADQHATDDVVLNVLVDSQWRTIVDRLQLPTEPGTRAAHAWLTQIAMPPAQASSATAAVMDTTVRVGLPQASGQDTRQWLTATAQYLERERPRVHAAIADATYAWAFDAVPALERRIVDEIRIAIARAGIPYARVVLERIVRLLENVLLPGMQATSSYDVPEPAAVPQDVQALLGTAGRSTLANPEEISQQLVEGLARNVRTSIQVRAAEALAKVIGPLCAESLAPLREELSEALKQLMLAVDQPEAAVALADVVTDRYAAWPHARNSQVPARFDVAHNEILLTPASAFEAQYASDVRAAAPQAGGIGYESAEVLLVPMVVEGIWPVGAGEEPPGGLLETLVPWRTGYFHTDPSTGTGLVPSRGRYELSLSTTAILERATSFVSRRGEPFDAYCSVSLRDFVTADHVPASEVQERHDLIVQRFRETLDSALPLAGVSEQAVLAVHGEGVAYRFKFSTLPFSGTPLVERLLEVVRTWPNIDATTVADFERSFDDRAGATKIDAFGSYKCYAPIVFSGLLDPVKEQWSSTQSFGREAFWSNRRSRPLQGALPVGAAERRAMIAGWYVGRVTGRITVPSEPYTEAVRVWDAEDGRWLPFPDPLLTPPSRFLSDFDWLPAVLESQLIAVAEVNNPPVLSSLAPYHRLRELWDGGDLEPMNDTGVGLATTSNGTTTLGTWLRTGVVPDGGRNVFPATTPTDRAEMVQGWIAHQRATIVEQLATAVTRRAAAAATPMFRDIAKDALGALESIERALEPALRIALAAERPQPPTSVIL